MSLAVANSGGQLLGLALLVMSRRYEDLSGPSVSAQINSSTILLLPIGATEQHGPHLPMSVDTIIAHETATAVVDACGERLDVWQLPTLSVSKSNEHCWAPGTLSFSPETMASILHDIGRSIASTNAERLVLLNGHGGNTTMLGTLLRELRISYGLKTFLMHPSLPPAYGGSSTASEHGMGIHGGLNETSVFMHLRPGQTRLELAERRVPESLVENAHVRFGGSVSFGWLSNDFSDDGYIGDPTDASPELGMKLFEHSVGELVDAMAEIKTFNFGRKS